MPMPRRLFREALYPVLRRHGIVERIEGGTLAAFFVTVILGRHADATSTFDPDRRKMLDDARNVLCREKHVGMIGVLEFAMLRSSEETRGHGRFDVVCPHAHMLVWMQARHAKGFPKRLRRRGSKLSDDMPVDRVVHAVRVKPTRADVARTVLYMLKSPCRGYRIAEGKWSSGEQLFPAGYLDQFGVLNRYSLRELCFSKGKQPGGGTPILNDALNAAKSRLERAIG